LIVKEGRNEGKRKEGGKPGLNGGTKEGRNNGTKKRSKEGIREGKRKEGKGEGRKDYTNLHMFFLDTLTDNYIRNRYLAQSMSLNSCMD